MVELIILFFFMYQVSAAATGGTAAFLALLILRWYPLLNATPLFPQPFLKRKPRHEEN
jgi:hypothetical protein